MRSVADCLILVWALGFLRFVFVIWWLLWVFRFSLGLLVLRFTCYLAAVVSCLFAWWVVK